MLSEKRYGLITGSKVDVLFPKRANPATQESYARELAAAKYFRWRQDTGSWQTEHGHFGEVLAMQEFQTKYPKAYKPDFVSIDDFGGSADCLIDGENFGVDFKCPTSLDHWLKYLYEGIDHQQERQAQMYMFLYKKEEWHIISFLTETQRMNNEGEVYPIPDDKRMIINVVKKDDKFEEQLREKAPSLLAMREMYFNLLVEKFGEPISL